MLPFFSLAALAGAALAVMCVGVVVLVVWIDNYRTRNKARDFNDAIKTDGESLPGHPKGILREGVLFSSGRAWELLFHEHSWNQGGQSYDKAMQDRLTRENYFNEALRAIERDLPGVTNQEDYPTRENYARYLLGQVRLAMASAHCDEPEDLEVERDNLRYLREKAQKERG